MDARWADRAVLRLRPEGKRSGRSVTSGFACWVAWRESEHLGPKRAPDRRYSPSISARDAKSGADRIMPVDRPADPNEAHLPAGAGRAQKTEEWGVDAVYVRGHTTMKEARGVWKQ